MNKTDYYHLPSFWVRNPAAVTSLTSLWLKGYSASIILVKIGAAGELTRNAIIGKAHRLGLPKHERGNNPDQKRKETKKKAAEPRKRKRLHIMVDIEVEPAMPKPAPMPLFEVMGMTDLPFERPATAVHLYDAEPNQCRWPVGHDGEHLFCGAPVLPDMKLCFCTAHYKRAISRTSIIGVPRAFVPRASYR